jgi:hypothetical protein
LTAGGRAGVVAAVVVALLAGVGLGFALDDGGGGGGPDEERLGAGGTSSSPSTTAVLPSTTTGPEGTTTTTGPERLGQESTLDVRGVGPIEAGMTLREAERVAGRPLRVEGFDLFEGLCYDAEPADLPGLSLMVHAPRGGAPSDPRDGIVVRATATTEAWRTVSGAHVGMTLDEVKRLYPSNLRDEPHQYQERGRYLTFEPQTARDRPYGVRFEVGDSGRVEAIHAGDAGAITAPEGCA